MYVSIFDNQLFDTTTKKCENETLMLLNRLFHYGPIFLRRFKLYMFSFTFGFMFANICFEKNQNSKIYVMFIINITWNETGICSFWAVWAVRAVGKNQVLSSASYVMLSININHNIGFFQWKNAMLRFMFDYMTWIIT